MKADTLYQQVRRFHKAFGHPLDKAELSLEEEMFRLKLVKEEFEEYQDAVVKLRYLLERQAEHGPNPDLTKNIQKARKNLLKEMSDIQVVVAGHAATRGWDIDVANTLVMNSNMSKLDDEGKPIYREDGKVLKGPNYKEPDLSKLV
jgi:predicted HAD superfamily Cof-like phosphohydrolase